MSEPVVGIVMGSDSDWPTLEPAAEALSEFGIGYEVHVVSAHRTPRRMLDYAESAAGRGLQVIIACAGGAAHLPGMIAAATPLPVATVSIGGGRNAGLLAVRVLAAGDQELRRAVERFQAALAEQVVVRDAALQHRLGTEAERRD